MKGRPIGESRFHQLREEAPAKNHRLSRNVELPILFPDVLIPEFRLGPDEFLHESNTFRVIHDLDGDAS